MRSETTTATPTALAITAAATAAAVTAAVLLSRRKRSNTDIDTDAIIPPTKLLPPNAKIGTLTNKRSQKLHTLSLPRTTDPSKPPNAAVVVIHGLGEHSARDGYLRLYKALNDGGVDVFTMDHHGHGRSEGMPRAYCNKHSDLVDDVEDYIKLCQSSYDSKLSPKKWIVIGQSLGGPIAVMTILRKNVLCDGLVLTSPGCGAELTFVTKIQLVLAPILDAVMPKARIVDGIRPEDLTRDLMEVQKYKDDPLITKGKICVRTAKQCLEFFHQMSERKGEVDETPLLILHGTMDKTSYVNATVNFFEGVKSQKKCFVRLPGFYHEPLNEPERDVVLRWVVDFVIEGKIPEGGTNGKVTDVVLIKE